nr:unnamed protein product [Callosobruchus chinensis]
MVIWSPLIYVQLFEYGTFKGILPEIQPGFRKGYSITSVLLNVPDYITKSLDAGLATSLILLDFSKAFDALDHLLLLAKLFIFGFDEMCLKLLDCYLYNRHQCAFVDNNFSDFQSVPQGSVPGPLFFIIYTSDMFEVIEHCNVQVTLMISVANDCINYDLKSIYIYASRHNLKLNARKCQVMLFFFTVVATYHHMSILTLLVNLFSTKNLA